MEIIGLNGLGFTFGKIPLGYLPIDSGESASPKIASPTPHKRILFTARFFGMTAPFLKFKRHDYLSIIHAMHTKKLT